MGWQDQGPVGGSGGDGSRSWRQPSSGQPVPTSKPLAATTKARSKQLFASSLAVACATLSVYLLMLLSRGCVSTELIVNTSTSYESKKVGAIPPNWLGDGDRKSLEGLSVKGGKLAVVTYSSDQEFQGRLKELFPSKDAAKNKDKVCVIYLSAHAVLESFIDEKVKPSAADIVLLVKDDDLEPKTKRVRLTEVFNSLERLPAEQKKLLLLDITRLQGSWRLGVYDNFVIEGIEEAVRKQKPKIANLFVMTSCSSGETSWESPDLGDAGQSVFGHFVARGLAGEADELKGRAGDRRVTVLELFRFVHTRVNDWVKRNRDPAGQHPQLLAADFDAKKALLAKDSTFPICTVGTRSTANSKTAGQSEIEGAKQELSKLLDLWKRRQKLEQPANSANAIYHLDPVGFRTLTHRLMRAEEFLIHHDVGQASAEIEKALAACVKLEKLAEQGHFAAAKFSSTGKSSTEKDGQFVRRLASRFGIGADPEMKTSSVEPNSTALSGEASIELPDEHLAKVLRDAHKLRGMPVAMKEIDSEKCRMLLVDVRKLSESVAFGHHTILPWLRDDLQVADQLRREAEDSYFVYETADARKKRATAKKEVTSSADATEKASEVQSLVDAARRSFEKLQTRAQILQDTQFALNRACATLPEWLLFVSDRWTDVDQRKSRDEVMSRYHKPIEQNHRPVPDILTDVWLTAKDDRPDSLHQLDKEILSIALEAIELRELLPTRFAPINDELLAKFPPVTKRLNDLFDRVQRQLQHEAEQLSNSTQKQYAIWHQRRDLLRCPTLKPATRDELLGKLIHDSTKLQAESDGKDSIEEAPQNDRQRSLWQMLCTIHTLSLVPAPKLADDKLWDGWHKARRVVERGEVSEVRDQVVELSHKLRTHWIRHSVETISDIEPWERLSRGLARDSLERKDLSARILFASDATNLQQEPTRRWEQFLIAELLLNSSERFLDDFWNEWYVEATRECLSGAERLDDKLLATDRQRVEELFAARRKSELLLEATPVEFGTQKTSVGSVRVKSQEGLPRGLATSWLAYKENDLRALKNQVLADFCKPPSFGLNITAKDARAAEENRTTIERPTSKIPEKKETCQASLLVPQVFFRNHVWSKQTTAKFNPCEPDGTQLRFSSVPTTAGIRVNGSDRHSVVFVLDASGSMVEKKDGQITLDRWTPAKAILLDVLSDMRAADRGNGGEPRQVELIVYGHIYRNRDRAIQINDWFNVETELPMSPLTDDVIARVRAKLENLEPYGSTPLLKGVKKASESLKAKKTPGTIIVITDGFPNDGARVDVQKGVFNTDDCEVVMNNLKNEIDDALNQAQSQRREIELQVILQGFSPDAKLTQAEDAAKGGLKAFIKKQRGTFYEAEKNDDLRKTLKLSTKGRPFFVIEDGQPLSKVREAPLGESVPDLTPGMYRVAFATPERLKESPLIELKGGELFDFELLAGSELKHVHPLALKGFSSFRRTPERPSYRFGYLQNFRQSDGRAAFVVGIQNSESESNRKSPFTERPQRLVLEIAPKGQLLQKAVPMSFRIEPDKSDPTWNVQVDEWPENSDAEIKAYAIWDQCPFDSLVELSSNPVWPLPISLPVSKTAKVEFAVTDVQTPANDRVDLDDSVEIRLKLSNQDDASVLTNNWRHLAQLHVQLRLNGKLIPHLEETAEVIASVNEIRWKFSNLPKEHFSRKGLSFAITSWYTFEQNSVALEQPLVIKEE